jgi:hypothetical protein
MLVSFIGKMDQQVKSIFLFCLLGKLYLAKFMAFCKNGNIKVGIQD